MIYLDKLAWAAVKARSAVASIAPWLGRAKAWSVKALDRMRRSFVAVVSSPAVWLACIAIGVGGFVVGFGAGAQGKRELRAEIADARRGQAAANERADLVAAKNAKLLAQVADLKGKLEAKQAEAARDEAVAPAPVKRRRAARRTSKTVAAPEAPFWPFR